MRIPSDAELARRLLLLREQGFSYSFYFRRNLAGYLIIASAFSLLLVVALMFRAWFVLPALIGMFVVTLARDLAWLRIMGQSWNFQKSVLDWSKIEQIALADESASAVDNT